MRDSLLQIEDLCVRAYARNGSDSIRIIDGLSLEIRPRSRMALVGESGCGKSSLGLAILGLLPWIGMHIECGSIRLQGYEIATTPEAGLRRLRGRTVAWVPQNPMQALNPVQTLAKQLSATLMRSRQISLRKARTELMEMLEHLEIAHPDRILRHYPHQMSGGMCQRMMIALALACRPRLLISDEPTSALDAATRIRVLNQITKACDNSNTALLLITHDFGIVAGSSQDVAVMYCGQIVERAPVEQLFGRPRHPYTAGLLAAIPARHPVSGTLDDIPGTPPTPGRWPTGCRFEPRCFNRQASCRTACLKPVVKPDREYRCHFPLNE